MKKIYFLLIVLFLSSLTLIHSQDEAESKLLKQFHTITSEEMMSWIQKLCSPEFNGRLTGTPEFQASAAWVADRLKEWALNQAGMRAAIFMVRSSLHCYK